MGARLLAVLLLLGVGIAPRPSHAAPVRCAATRTPCLAAARLESKACRRACRDEVGVGEPACRAACKTGRRTATDVCREVADPCTVTCGLAADSPDLPGCLAAVRSCRTAARTEHRRCRQACPGRRTGAFHRTCLSACDRARAADEGVCGFAVARTAVGAGPIPELPAGRAADLSILLDSAEMAFVDAADARATGLRSRPLRVWLGTPHASLRIAQVRHHFTFGFALDTRKFVGRDADFAFYTDLARRHAGLAVVENNAKWAKIEPAPGVRDYTFADADVAAAAQLGFRVKGHTLSWGIVPPFSSSGVPPWALTRWAPQDLEPAERDALRETLRRHVAETVERYRDEITIWDVTNETMQPLAQWFVAHLDSPGQLRIRFQE
jgi:hypothetical protein